MHQLHRGAVTYSYEGKTYGALVHFFRGMQKDYFYEVTTTFEF